MANVTYDKQLTALLVIDPDNDFISERSAERAGARPMIETYPLDKAAEAYARMMSGKAQSRVVLTM
jgi:NADPH:quinone reductase-like Zn-dependent oxidoreductase